MLYYLIIVLAVAEWLFNRVLVTLDIRASRQPLPPLLSDLYDGESYRRQQDYLRTNARFGWLTSTTNLIISVVFFAAGGFGWLDGVVRSWLSGVAWDYKYAETLVTLVYLTVLGIVSSIISLPLRYYDTFVIEERFGFNRTGRLQFARDVITGILLRTALLWLLLGILSLIYLSIPDIFWILAFGVVIAFQLFMGEFYSLLIVPLFNKQTPLPQGELRDAIEELARKADFRLTDIYVMDAGKRSSKANAYFTGLGKRKRVVLYDTLIEQLTTEEIVGVLAHEIGHYKHHHAWRGMAIGAVEQLIIFYLMGLCLSSQSLAAAAGAAQPSVHINILMFSSLLSPLNILLDLFGNMISRRHEYEADAFACRYGCGKALVSGLKKITAQAMSNVTPHPLRVFFDYSHPTLLQRIEAVNRLTE